MIFHFGIGIIMYPVFLFSILTIIFLSVFLRYRDFYPCEKICISNNITTETEEIIFVLIKMLTLYVYSIILLPIPNHYKEVKETSSDRGEKSVIRDIDGNLPENYQQLIEHAKYCEHVPLSKILKELGYFIDKNYLSCYLSESNYLLVKKPRDIYLKHQLISQYLLEIINNNDCGSYNMFAGANDMVKIDTYLEIVDSENHIIKKNYSDVLHPVLMSEYFLSFIQYEDDDNENKIKKTLIDSFKKTVLYHHRNQLSKTKSITFILKAYLADVKSCLKYPNQFVNIIPDFTIITTDKMIIYNEIIEPITTDSKSKKNFISDEINTILLKTIENNSY